MRSIHAAVIAALLLVAPAQADDQEEVTMTDNDPGGTSSFNTAGQWDDQNAPHSGSDYFTGNQFLRTPASGGGSHDFAGDSLTIGNDGMVLYKSGDGGAISATDLIIDNGAYYMSDDNLSANSELAGGITLVDEADITAFSTGASGNTLNVTASIGGTGNLNINRDGASFAGISMRADQDGPSAVNFSGINTYTGDTTVFRTNFNLQDGGELFFDIGASGVNNTFTAGAEVTAVDLDGLFRFELDSAGTTVGDSWDVVIDETVGALSYGDNFSVASTEGDFTTAGLGVWEREENGVLYQFSEGTGTLSVIPEPSTYALLFGAGAFGLIVLRRRYKA